MSAKDNNNIYPPSFSRKLNYYLYGSALVVCIMSIYLTSILAIKSEILGDILVLILICLFGYIMLRYITIPLISRIFKVKEETLESWLFNQFKSKNNLDLTKISISVPFRSYLLQIPIKNIILTFLLSGITIGITHYATEVTTPIRNIQYITDGKLTTGKLVDQSEEEIDDEMGNGGYMEWFGYEFDVDDVQYMCWVPWIEENTIIIQYLDNNPGTNRLYEERSVMSLVLNLIGSFMIIAIILGITLFSNGYQELWKQNILAIHIEKGNC